MVRQTFTYKGKRYDVRAKNEKELKKKISEKKKSIRNEFIVSYTVAEWCDVFLDLYKQDVALRTYDGYIIRFRLHIIPYIGKKKLNEVTHIDVQNVLNKMRGKSSNSIRKVYNDLSQLFEKAVVARFITSSPVIGVVVPKGYSNKRRAITNHERELIELCCQWHPYGAWVYSMLLCGCRPHETALLQYKDVVENTLHIRGTKSKAADRIVPLPDKLKSKLNLSSGLEEYLFHTESGLVPKYEHNRADMWGRFKKDAGLDTDVTMYCLRHTYCTDLQTAGVPINVAKDFMGHSSITLTANIYTHTSDKSWLDASDKYNAFLATFLPH